MDSLSPSLSLSEKEEVEERAEKKKKVREGLTPRLTATDPRSTRPFSCTGFIVKTQVTRYSIYRRNLCVSEKLVLPFPVEEFEKEESRSPTQHICAGWDQSDQTIGSK